MERAVLRIVVTLFSLEKEAAHIHLFIIPPALCPIGALQDTFHNRPGLLLGTPMTKPAKPFSAATGHPISAETGVLWFWKVLREKIKC